MSRLANAAAALSVALAALSTGVVQAPAAEGPQLGPAEVYERDWYDPLKGPDGTMDDDNGGPNVPDTRPTR